MRKCLRCENEMIDNLEIISNDGYGMAVKEKGAFKMALGRLKCAACPNCGHVELYLESTEKLKNII